MEWNIIMKKEERVLYLYYDRWKEDSLWRGLRREMGMTRYAGTHFLTSKLNDTTSVSLPPSLWFLSLPFSLIPMYCTY